MQSVARPSYFSMKLTMEGEKPVEMGPIRGAASVAAYAPCLPKGPDRGPDRLQHHQQRDHRRGQHQRRSRRQHVVDPALLAADRLPRDARGPDRVATGLAPGEESVLWQMDTAKFGNNV